MALTDVTAHSHIRVWFLNKHILVVRLPILICLFWLLMTSVITLLGLRILQDVSQKTNAQYHILSWGLVWLCVMHLTSFPIQRCCPTPFSHLWWRLILQALQRRPCFAVFPARNTTCLAVVPGKQKQEAIGSDVSCQELHLTGALSEQQIIHKKAEEKENIRIMSGEFSSMHCAKPVTWPVEPFLAHLTE